MEKINFKESIVLNDRDILIKSIKTTPSIKEKKESMFNSSIKENLTYNEGLVSHVGKSLPEEWIGKLIYYTRNASTKLEGDLKGYVVIQNSLKILIRKDIKFN